MTTVTRVDDDDDDDDAVEEEEYAGEEEEEEDECSPSSPTLPRQSLLGVKAVASRALGITETLSGFNEARRHVFSLLVCETQITWSHVAREHLRACACVRVRCSV